ncbi:substrate-binding periplasmic protein [Solimicrobium silvestre]|uniref:Bacterial extracellular solute-binding protein, family 3 n=1 Tax=Solimicrobium silvestre TaxID=2099400 RepID=A0A2S9GVN2_9BURK|nr:transporter substrate-binding domain-containing protein [Solimicrobium silvestre]PRC91785.1 Bacterial extracellular solute-binding protein, family 3 [Solimicrobium silvestre]
MKLITFAILLVTASNLALSQPLPMVVDIIQSEPLGFQSKNGTPTGLHFDILTALSKLTGVPIKINIVPKARLIYDLKNGIADGAILFPNPEVDAITIDSGVTDQTKLVALGKVGFPLKSYDDLVRAKTVLMLVNTTFGNPFDSDLRLDKDKANSYDQMVTMFIHDRANVITGNLMALLYLLKKVNSVSKVDTSGLLFRNLDNHFYIAKKSHYREKSKVFINALDEMMNDGTINNIAMKYFDDHDAKLNLSEY